jgi:site-specific recombinase XerD
MEPAFSSNNLSRLTRDYLIAAGIAKRGACHLLRHTMATGMLEHGTDVRGGSRRSSVTRG